MNKISLLFLCFLLLVSFVTAYNINHSVDAGVSNNVIQTGSVQFFCGGYVFNVNNATQNFTNTINWTLSVPDCNSTSCEYLKEPINNLTQNCNSLSKTCYEVINLFNTSFKYYPLYADCYANLTYYSKQASEKDYFENKSIACDNEKNIFQNNFQSCNDRLNTCSIEKDNLDKKYKGAVNKIYFAAIIGLILGGGGVWFFKFKQKTSKSPADITGRAP